MRLEDVLKLCYQEQFKLIISLENVLKTFWIHLEGVLARRLEDVLKMSWRFLEDVLKTSRRRLEDVFAGRLEHVLLKTSWKRLEDVLKTYNKDEYIGLDLRRLEDVLKTPSEDENERLLQDVLKTNVCWVLQFQYF